MSLRTSRPCVVALLLITPASGCEEGRGSSSTSGGRSSTTGEGLAATSSAGGGGSAGSTDPSGGGGGQNSAAVGSTGIGAGGAASACEDVFPDAGDYPCEVFAVLAEKCLPCHSDPPVDDAPFSLATYEDTREPYLGRKRWERMAEVIQPIGDQPPFMPFGSAPDLTAPEKAILDAWFGACAPPADRGCE